MKKLLVASTALVAFAAVSTSAQAADPIKLSISGFMNQWAGYSDNENDNGAANYSQIGTHSDVEIYFRGSTKLDNGLTVGVNIDTERSGGTDGDSDDTFLSVSGDALGTVKIGSTKGVSYGLGNKHGDVGVGLDDGIGTKFVNTGLATANDSNRISTLTNGNDGHKVVYLTPNFGGIQAGFSYGLVSEGNVGTADLQDANNDIQYNAGIAYKGDFGGVAVGADINYEMFEDGGLTGGGATSATTEGLDQVKNEETIRAGLSVSTAGFTVAASYIDTDNVNFVTDQDTQAWEVGVKYATGPYAVSAAYFQRETEDSGLSTAKEDTLDVILVSGSYNLGAGVTLAGSVLHIESDDASDNSANQTDEGSNWGVIAGLKVAF
ncbi:porin [Terasakiella sp. SH-1]|uniref:porin n=1 Tax=Terasakiella sp. SH-1 TaxID=2560057 RepID=UPI0010740BAC|nr:porin [Terasakiella sp. SH-1]